MQFVDEFRDPELAKSLLQRLQKIMEKQPHFTPENPLYLMEVCGGHTHTIFKFGLDRLLPKSIEFIHGPGCPVCVLPMGRIDVCIEIARRPEVIFCTFGDAMRVRGRLGSLLEAKAQGADVRIVYSPLDALNIASNNPDKKSYSFHSVLKRRCQVPRLPCNKRKTAVKKLFCGMPKYYYHPDITQLIVARTSKN